MNKISDVAMMYTRKAMYRKAPSKRLMKRTLGGPLEALSKKKKKKKQLRITAPHYHHHICTHLDTFVPSRRRYSTVPFPFSKLGHPPPLSPFSHCQFLLQLV